MSSNKNKPFTTVVLLIIALACLGFAGFRFSDWYRHTQGSAQPPETDQTITYSTDKPDEKLVSTNSEYAVRADQPRRILAQPIGVEGFIQRVGKGQNGAIAVPSNVHFAGWYVHSVKPGEPGLSVIDGHVSSRYSSAIFAGLNKLQKSDVIQIEFGDRSIRSFEVVDKRELPQAVTADFLLSKNDNIDSQLNLVTCDGYFNKKSSSYSNRLMIVTKRID